MGGDAFLHFRPGKAEEFQRQRSIERWPRHAQPVVQAVFGPAQRALRAGREFACHFQRLGLQFRFFTAERHQPDPLGLLAAHLFAGQQVVLGLRHPAQQRPHDGGMVPGRDAEARMPVDDPRVLCGDRNIRQQPDHQPRTDRRPVHCGHHDLRAVDDVVDNVARLAPHALPYCGVVGDVLHQRQVATGGKSPAGAADDGHAHLGVAIDVAPDVGKLAVHAMSRGGELAVLAAHHDFQDSWFDHADVQVVVVRIIHVASSILVRRIVRRRRECLPLQ